MAPPKSFQSSQAQFIANSVTPADRAAPGFGDLPKNHLAASAMINASAKSGFGSNKNLNASHLNQSRGILPLNRSQIGSHTNGSKPSSTLSLAKSRTASSSLASSRNSGLSSGMQQAKMHRDDMVTQLEKYALLADTDVYNLTGHMRAGESVKLKKSDTDGSHLGASKYTSNVDAQLKSRQPLIEETPLFTDAYFDINSGKLWPSKEAIKDFTGARAELLKTLRVCGRELDCEYQSKNVYDQKRSVLVQLSVQQKASTTTNSDQDDKRDEGEDDSSDDESVTA